MMGKRKSEGLELRLNRPPSPEAAKSSSGEWPDLSSPSSSSSQSYSSKMAIEGSSTTEAKENNVQLANAPVTKAMALVGCPRCYMYVMSSEVDPKCPQCKSNVFLDLFREDNFKTDG